jgi:hypothetical protein
MANVGIMFDKIGFLPLTLTETVAGVTTTVATPPADAFAVVSSAPTKMSMTIGVDPGGSGATGVIISCLVTESDPTNSGGGFTGNVTDSAGDIAVVIGPYDITPEPVVPNITAGLMTFTANPTPPTAAGP